MDFTDRVVYTAVGIYLFYILTRILDEIEKKRKKKNQLPKPKMSHEEIIQREKRRTRWARRKAKKHMKKE